MDSGNFSHCNLYAVDVDKDIVNNFVTACSPLTILFNSFALLLAAYYADFEHHLEQFFVFSMTLADLMFGMVYSTTVKISMDIPSFLCRPWYILVWTSSMASVMFLLLLNVHKIVLLFCPIHAFVFMSKKRVLIQVAICWCSVLLCSVIFSIEPIWVRIDPQCRSCIGKIDPKFYSIMLICFYVLPLVGSLVLSICIFGFAQRRSNKRTAGARNDRKKMFKRIFFVFTSTIWTAVTFLPYRISLSKIVFCKYFASIDEYRQGGGEDFAYRNSTDSNNVQQHIKAPTFNCFTNTIIYTQYCFLCLLTFGTIINPLITIFTQENYRKGLCEIWNKLPLPACCRRKKSPASDYKYIKGEDEIKANASVAHL